jgi:hypothetical protein
VQKLRNHCEMITVGAEQFKTDHFYSEFSLDNDFKCYGKQINSF